MNTPLCLPNSYPVFSFSVSFISLFLALPRETAYRLFQHFIFSIKILVSPTFLHYDVRDTEDIFTCCPLNAQCLTQ